MPEDPGTDRTVFNNGREAARPGHSDTDPTEHTRSEAETTASGGKSPPGFLELFYGVLFEPVKTMNTVAGAPPLGTVAMVVTVPILLGSFMGFLTYSRVLEESLPAAGMEQLLSAMQAMAPFWLILSLLLGYLKWFGYSAVFHLVADLLGGRGGARGVFAVVGLAELPSALLIPFQLLGYWFGVGNTAVTILLGLAGLAVWIWHIVLLVIGVRAVHHLSTGRSLATILTPFLALVLFAIILLAALMAMVISMPFAANLPEYF